MVVGDAFGHTDLCCGICVFSIAGRSHSSPHQDSSELWCGCLSLGRDDSSLWNPFHSVGGGTLSLSLSGSPYFVFLAKKSRDRSFQNAWEIHHRHFLQCGITFGKAGYGCWLEPYHHGSGQ